MHRPVISAIASRGCGGAGMSSNLEWPVMSPLVRVGGRSSASTHVERRGQAVGVLRDEVAR